MKILIPLVIVLIVAVVALASIELSRADIYQARAAIEAARAVQMASAGQTAATTSLGIVNVLLIAGLIVFGICILWLLYQFKIKPLLGNAWHPTTQMQPRNYAPRINMGNPSAGIPPADPIQQLVQLELMRYLRETRQSYQHQLPAQIMDKDDDDLWEE